MECVVAFAPAVPSAIVSSPLTWAYKTTKRIPVALRAKPYDNEDDPLLEAAVHRASLRFQETNRPDPLFVDQYAGCFVCHNIPLDMEHHPHHYCLATKFIDDKLLATMNNVDGLRQVVLLTDGMDTRPYRLSWPTATIIFDISPERVFRKAAQKLKDVGAKIPKRCFFLHVPMESSVVLQILCSKGFSGNRPSIWVLQGLPLMTLASFEDVLSVVSSLAMKGCLLLGELPTWLTETEVGVKREMDKLFVANGFRLDWISYNEIAENLGRDPPAPDGIIFVAEQLRFSDDQMEIWRREFQRVEEEGDEEGFEEL